MTALMDTPSKEQKDFLVYFSNHNFYLHSLANLLFASIVHFDVKAQVCTVHL